MQTTVRNTLCLGLGATAFWLLSSCTSSNDPSKQDAGMASGGKPGGASGSSSGGTAGSSKGGASGSSSGGKSGTGGVGGGGSGGVPFADAYVELKDGSAGDNAPGPDVGPDTPTAVQAFSDCRFHFGTIDDKARQYPGLAAEVDLFGGPWIGQKDTFELGGICDEIKAGKPLAGKTPALVSYIIAFTARQDQNLQDCNMAGGNNLCTAGATYMRAHLEDRIIPKYETYAKGFAAACGTTQPIIWLMEPDFYQYSGQSQTQAYTFAEAGQIMARLVATVKKNLPNAVFSMDISPWIPDNGAAWYSKFTLSDFSFVNTSGGGTDAANAKIRSNNSMTWAGVHEVTGKPIIADTGYGAGGGSAGHDGAWDIASNINSRIKDGVIAIIQYNPKNDWAQSIISARPQIDKLPCY
jgi:hypothetical protein